MTSTTGAAVASALADNSADLAIDLMAGKAILSKLSAVLPSGDDKAIEDVLTNNGYHTTVEGVNAVLQTANPGPGFDIKMVAGLYRFSAPANMTDKQMRIDPLGGKLYIDEFWVGNTTDQDGNVVFTYSGNHFSLVFSVTYDATGVPNPFKFSTSDPNAVQAQGKQVVPQPPQPPPQDWTSTPGWMQAGMIMTVFGGGLPLLLAFLQKVKKIQQDRNDKASAESLKALGKHANRLRVMLEASAEAVGTLSSELEDGDFQVTNHQDEVEQAIEAQVNGDMDQQHDVDTPNVEVIRANAENALKYSLLEAYKEAKGAQILQSFDKFNQVLGEDGKARVVNKVIEARLQRNNIYSNPQNLDWFKDTVQAFVLKFQTDTAGDQVTAAEAARDMAQRDFTAAQAEHQRVVQERETFMAAHGKNPDNMTPAEYKAHLDELRETITRLDGAAEQAQKEVLTHEKDVQSEQNKKDELEKDREAAENRRAESAGEAFHGPE